MFVCLDSDGRAGFVGGCAQRIHAGQPRVKGVVSAAVSSEFVFGAAQSGQRVDRVEGDDQRIGGSETQHRFDGGEVGDDECQGRHQNRRKQRAESGDQLLAGFARLVSMVVPQTPAQQVPVSTQSVRLAMRPTGAVATGALSIAFPHAGQNRAGPSTLFPQWPQYAIVCFSPSNRLDCHRFNVALQHYVSTSPYE